jgi:hypothetical protein
LKGPLPEGVLARIALKQIVRTETVHVIDGPFPGRHVAPKPSAVPAEVKPASVATSQTKPRFGFAEMRRHLRKQQKRALEAYLQRTVEDDLVPRFRLRLDNRPGADYLDRQHWWLGRHYYRSRSSKCWKNTRAARYQRFVADRYRSA